MIKIAEIWRFEENPEKIGKNPETGWISGGENYDVILEM